MDRTEKERAERTTSAQMSVKLSEGLLIAASSALAYAAVFCYEAGFADKFGIPYQMIRIDMMGILITSAAMWGVLLTLFAVSNAIYAFLPKRWKGPERHSDPVYREIWVFYPALLATLAYLLGYGGNWGERLGLVGVWAFMLMFSFVWPIMTHADRKDLSYREKLRSEQRAEAEKGGRTTLYDYLARRLGRTGTLAGFWLLFSLWLCRIVGAGQAMKQQEFLVPVRQPQLIVARIYGERLICFPLDGESRTVGKELILIGLSEDAGRILEARKVGPVKFQKDKKGKS